MTAARCMSRDDRLSLRLAFERFCDGDASVEVKSGHDARAVTGSGALVLKLRPGTVRYKLRCAGDARAAKPRASGALTVKRDSGDVPVSRRPAVNVLDADGRRYTVLFQTRLPALTMGWAAVPRGATKLSLHVESPAGKQTFPSPTASRRSRPGRSAKEAMSGGTRRRTGGRRRRRPSPSASTTRRRRPSSFPGVRATRRRPGSSPSTVSPSTGRR